MCSLVMAPSIQELREKAIELVGLICAEAKSSEIESQRNKLWNLWYNPEIGRYIADYRNKADQIHRIGA